MRLGFIAFLLFIIIPGLGGAEGKGSPAARGGLLVIAASADAEKALAPLLALRRGQGWAVTVKIAARGSREKEIRALIAAERKRAPGLSHLMLAGSNAALPMAHRFNPSRQLADDSPWRWTDQSYGIAVTSGTAALAVGRLPADDPAALTRLAEKIVTYEQSLNEIKPEVFLLSGRQPADPTPKLLGVSEQSIADTASATFLRELRGQLTRLRTVARTAFPGPEHFDAAQGPEVLRQAIAARPTMLIYAGHANRDGFATCHDEQHVVSIGSEAVERMEVSDVCGPFFSGGCSMLEPGEKTRSIGELLMLRDGGPVAFVGFTAPNEDYVVMQTFEILVGELGKARRTTLGELLATLRRRLASEPQSARSKLVQSFTEGNAQGNPKLKETGYRWAVDDNNALLTLMGDPCTTIVIP